MTPLCVGIALAIAVPASVVQDPGAQTPAPSMVEWSVPSHGETMNAVLYLAGGQGPHGLVILLHGFPGYERNFDLAQSIRRAGFHVLVFHYRGAWGSGGDFSFSHAIEDTGAAVQYARSTEVATRFGIDADRIVLAGHSMGGFLAAEAAARDPRIAGVAMIAAWNIGHDGARMTAAEEKEALSGFAEEMGPLRGCTPQSLVAEMKEKGAAWDFTSFAPALRGRPVLIISANDGGAAQSEALRAALVKAGATRAACQHLDADHGFSGKRIALQAAVVRWLLQFRRR